jgi:hypothetical protein
MATETEEKWQREMKETAARSNRRLGIGVAVAVVIGVSYVVLNGLGLLEKTCEERGVEYFKSIGSYPTLSSGADAEAEARDRCARSDKAFP